MAHAAAGARAPVLVQLQVVDASGSGTWAAAQQVVIGGSTGSKAALVNGCYEFVDREVYRKVGEPDRWLFIARDGNWTVGPTTSKDARKTESAGWAHAVAPAGGRPPAAGAIKWKLFDGSSKTWGVQTVRVEVLDVESEEESEERHPQSEEEKHHPMDQSWQDLGRLLGRLLGRSVDEPEPDNLVPLHQGSGGSGPAARERAVASGSAVLTTTATAAASAAAAGAAASSRLPAGAPGPAASSSERCRLSQRAKHLAEGEYQPQEVNPEAQSAPHLSRRPGADSAAGCGAAAAFPNVAEERGRRALADKQTAAADCTPQQTAAIDKLCKMAREAGGTLQSHAVGQLYMTSASKQKSAKDAIKRAGGLQALCALSGGRLTFVPGPNSGAGDCIQDAFSSNMEQLLAKHASSGPLDAGKIPPLYVEMFGHDFKSASLSRKMKSALSGLSCCRIDPGGAASTMLVQFQPTKRSGSIPKATTEAEPESEMEPDPASHVVKEVQLHKGKPSALVTLVQKELAPKFVERFGTRTCNIGKARVRILPNKSKWGSCSALFVGWQRGCELSEAEIRAFFADNVGKLSAVQLPSGPLAGADAVASETLRGRIVGLKGDCGFIRPHRKKHSENGDDDEKAGAGDEKTDVHFHKDRLKFGGLQPHVGDAVVYTLQPRARQKSSAGRKCASAASVWLERCSNRRTVDDYVSYLESVRTQVAQSDAVEQSLDAVWDSIARQLDRPELLAAVVDLVQAIIRAERPQLSPLVESIVNAGMLDQGGELLLSMQADEIESWATLCLFMFRHCVAVRRRLIPFVDAVLALMGDVRDPRHELLLKLLKVSTVAAGSIADLDWTEIPLIVTEAELRAPDSNVLLPVKTHGAYSSLAAYFETYFRLLREDCFSSLKRGIDAWFAGTLDPRDMTVHTAVELSSIVVPPTAASGTVLALKLQSSIVGKAPMFGNLMAISATRGDLRRPVWATIANAGRDNDTDQAHKSGVLFVQLCSDLNEQNDAQVVEMLFTAGCVVAESPTFYRAYEPVLRSMQTMEHEEFPFTEEIVNVEAAAAVESIVVQQATTIDPAVVFDDVQSRCDMQMFRRDLRHQDATTASTLDRSQLDAVEHALAHRVSVIQGPPGAGKTFIGIKLLQLLLSMKTSDGNAVVDRPILVLTYKNHALDDFLNECLKPDVVGPNHVARSGGHQIEGTPMEACNVRVLERNADRDEAFFKVRTCREEIDARRQEVKQAAEQLAKSFVFDHDSLVHESAIEQLKCFLRGASGQQLRDSCIAANNACAPEHIPQDSSAEDILILLQQGDEASRLVAYNAVNQLVKKWMPKLEYTRDLHRRAHVLAQSCSARPPPATGRNAETPADELERLANMHIDAHDSDWMKDIVRLKFSDTAVTMCDAGLTDNETAALLNISDIWGMEPLQKALFIQVLLARHVKAARAKFEECLVSFKAAGAAWQAAKDSRHVSILCRRKVLGMTITGASINRTLLEKLRPPVVIVEEAAEVLEPQLVAALGSWVEHLIMIGDHKQLRPSVNAYHLERDYNFHLSLMERLVNNNMPYATLSTQNRMRPEFAELLLDIYPELTTNERIIDSRIAPSCVEHSMFFWAHSDPEQGDRGYRNEGEAERVVQLALFFVQQGYNPSDITVLSAYAGQVKLLKEKLVNRLSKVWDGRASASRQHDQADALRQLERASGRSRPEYIELSSKLGTLEVADGTIDKVQQGAKRLKELQGQGGAHEEAAHRADKLLKALNVILEASTASEGDDGQSSNRQRGPARRGSPKTQAARSMYELARKFQADGHIQFAKGALIACQTSIGASPDKGSQVVQQQCASALASIRLVHEEIQVHTVDRYQGAENEIVIVSLVRSQPDRPDDNQTVGFLKELNRRCVAQSRARCGLYFVGNSTTMRNSQGWVTLIDKMDALGCVGDRIPLRCPRHPLESQLDAQTGADIDLKAGICAIKCLQPMGLCDHLCQRQCHADRGEHFLCTQTVLNARCNHGHPLSQRCCDAKEDIRCITCSDIYESNMALQLQQERMRREHAQKIADLKRQEVQDANDLRLAQELHKKEIAEVKMLAAKKKQKAEADAKTRQLQADKKAELEAVKQHCEDELKWLRRQHRNRPTARVHFQELRPAGADAADFFAVKDRTEKYTQAQHGINMAVTKIERVLSSKLHEQWLECRLGLHGSTHMQLFHGTNVEATKGICENGFRLPEWSDDNMFGRGTYFAADSSKSANNLYTKGSNRLLLCDVLLGKPCEVSGLLGQYPLKKHQKMSRKGRPYLDVDLQKVRAAGFDSVFAKRGGSMSSGGVAFDEFIVYDPRQALPRYVVHFGGAGSTGAVPAARPGRNIGAGVTKHVLKPQGTAVKQNEESIHFNQAVAQFTQMLGDRQGLKVKEVDWYQNPGIERRFDECRRKLRYKDEVWVFHGTPDASVVPKIMKDGFKVGGEDIGVRNGAAYGNGVYTATGPDTPMGYAQDTGCVILARALKGNHGGRAGGDSWSPHTDWLIFRTKEQLLPCYVVHY
eukprot:SAG11_NODE_651_length_7926_cov_2.465057_1_plen_2511_part_00